MIKRIALVALAIGLALLYMGVLPVTTIYASALRVPPWWSQLFFARTSGILAWLVTVHTFAVFFASLPFALAINLIYGRMGVWVALALTVAVYAVTTLPSVVSFFGDSSLRVELITMFDTVKLIGLMPALVWGIGALRSNYRIGRPMKDGLPSSSIGARGAHAERRATR